MLKKILVILIFSISCLLSFCQNTEDFSFIPKQSFNPMQLVYFPVNKDTTLLICEEFEISTFVTFADYKKYLVDIKKDSSIIYYHTQLPDSSIASLKIYEKYLNKKKFNIKPVVGLSWETCVNYCKWKTKKDLGDSLGFKYRLPHCSEWLSSLNYYTEKTIPHDLNQFYSEWLVNTRDFSVYNFNSYIAAEGFVPFYFDQIYNHKENDSPSLKRKLIIGNSYLFQYDKALKHNGSFYANQGYRFVCFRLVKEYL